MAAKNHVSLIRSWLKMFDFQWARHSDDDVLRAWTQALRDVDSARLEAALNKTWQSSQYYPTIEQVRENLPSEKLEGIAWIPPQGGHCHKDSMNGQRLQDGRETRCGCRECRPAFPWCHWLYSDGQFCDQFQRAGEPYCGKHFERACEHHDISSLSLKEQVEYLLDLDRNGHLLFTTDDVNPAIATTTMPPVASRKEFAAAVRQLAQQKSMLDSRRKTRRHDGAGRVLTREEKLVTVAD